MLNYQRVFEASDQHILALLTHVFISPSPSASSWKAFPVVYHPKVIKQSKMAPGNPRTTWPLKWRNIDKL